MNRRGAALLIVLWLLVMLTALVGAGMARARRNSLESQNRMAFTRAGWAREACLEVLLGRTSRDSLRSMDIIRNSSIDSLDLGSGTWCSVQLSDPGNKLNINTTDTLSLGRLFRDSTLVRAVIAGRPWPSEEALPTALDEWRKLLTTRGLGRITLMTAPTAVLEILPGIDAAGAQAVVGLQQERRLPVSLEELITRLPVYVRDNLMPEYSRFAGLATVHPQVLVAFIEGKTAIRPVIARMTVTLVPTGRRLAVIRREVE